MKKLIRAIICRVQDREGYVNKTKLIKYLYLTDIEHFKLHKETFTGFDWFFYKYGPYASEYNDIYEEMKKTAEISVRSGDRADLDTEFISTDERVEFDNIFENITEESIVKRIIDRWATEHLGKMLDYVYFYTLPMEEVNRGEKLNFNKLLETGMVPKFELTKGTLTKREILELKEKVKVKIAGQKKYAAPEAYFEPPRYDDLYWEEIEKLNNDNIY